MSSSPSPPPSPSPSDDFIVVEHNNLQNLAIRTRSPQDEVDQYSDSDLDHVSRLGSVRSLSSTSPSLFGADDELEDDDVAMASIIPCAIDHDINTVVQHDPPTQPDHDIISQFQPKQPCSEAMAATKDTRSARSQYAYHKSPDDAFPGAGVLVPYPTSLQRHTLANIESDSPQIPIRDVDALQKTEVAKRCDHTTIDQYIMDALIENALNTRLEKEFGSSGPREQHLRQQMMARLRSLPVDHPVVKEAMKHARWGSFLFQHQYRHSTERKHIYTNVFTSIELAALYLLLECHKKHFGVACSFADLPDVFGSNFLDQLDLSSFTRGSKLALQIQTTCMMTIGFREVRPFLDQYQLRRRTRTEILQQAERLKSTMDIRDGLTQLEVNVRELPDTRSLNLEEIEILRHAPYERIAIRNVFNDTLTSLPDLTELPVQSQVQIRGRRSSCLKREAPEDDVSAILSPLSPPAKKLSIPGAYPTTVRDRSSGSTSAIYSYAASDHLKQHEVSEQTQQRGNNLCEERIDQTSPSRRRRLQENTKNPTDHMSEMKATGSKSLQDWQMQLMLLERQNKKRLMMQFQEPKLLREQTLRSPACASDTPTVEPPQPGALPTTSNVDPSTFSGHQLQEYQMQLMLLEQQKMRRLMLRCQEPVLPREQTVQSLASASNPSPVGHSQSPASTSTSSITPSAPTGYRLQDYQMQIMLLEQQNKKRQMLEQKSTAQQFQAQPKQSRASELEANSRQVLEQEQIIISSHPPHGNNEPPDYQMQLMLLEQQNKKRLMFVRQTVDEELSKYVEEEDAAKFRCRVPNCTKLFKGREYWRKHVETRHKEWHKQLSDNFMRQGMGWNAKSKSSFAPEAPEGPHCKESTAVAVSSDENMHGGLDRPASGYLPNGSTFVATMQDPTRVVPAKTTANETTTTLPIRSAPSMAATNRNNEKAKDLSSNSHDNPNVEPVSLRRGFSNDSETTFSNQTQMESLQQCNQQRHSSAWPEGEAQKPQPYARSHTQTPISATAPFMVRYDKNGVPWSAFEYSREPVRVKMEYTIRFDVESVDLTTLDTAFKDKYCIYASSTLDFSEQVETHRIGWALAHLNPCLRANKDVLSAAVDHYKQLQARGKFERLSSTAPIQPPPLSSGSAVPPSPYQALDAARDEQRKVMIRQQNCLQDYETQLRLLEQQCKNRGQWNRTLE